MREVVVWVLIIIFVLSLGFFIINFDINKFGFLMYRFTYYYSVFWRSGSYMVYVRIFFCS